MAESERPQGWQVIGTPDDPANDVRAQAIAAIERGDPFILLSFDRVTGTSRSLHAHLDLSLLIGMLDRELRRARSWDEMNTRASFTDHAAEDAAMFERAKRVAEVMAEQVRQHCPVCSPAEEPKPDAEPATKLEAES